MYIFYHPALLYHLKADERTHRSDHLTEEHNRSLPTTGAAREDPLTVELQKELRAGMDVNPSTVLPRQDEKKDNAECEVWKSCWF